MSATFLSLFDLLASRFRSDSQNQVGGEGGEGGEDGAGGMTVTVSDPSESSEGHSQPRSRSHTETVRPTNLPPMRSNRSPIQSRQNRSMTSHDPSILNQNNNNNLIVPPLNLNISNINNPNNNNNPSNNNNNNNLNNQNIDSKRLAAINNKKRRSTNVGRRMSHAPHPSSLTPPINGLIPSGGSSGGSTPSSPRRSPLSQQQQPKQPDHTSTTTTTTNTTTTTTDNTTITPTPNQVPNIIVGDSSNTIPTVVISQSTVPDNITQSHENLIHSPPMSIGDSQDEGVEMQEFMGQETDDDEYSYDEYEEDVPMGEEVPYEAGADIEKGEDVEAKPIPFNHHDFFINISKYFGSMLGLVVLVSTVAVAYGLFEIYAGCRYVDVSDVKLWPHWGIVTHSISRILLNTALCMYPYFLLLMFFGFKKTMVPLWVGLASSLGASAWATFNVVHPVLNPTLALLPSYFFFVVAMVVSAHYMGHKIKSPRFRHLFMGQFVLAAAILVTYDFFLVPWYVRTSSINKSVIRILIHPAMCALSLFTSRACSSRIKPDIPGTNVFPVLIFMWFSTYYGRFFNSIMSLAFMTGTMVIVSLLELLWRTTLRPRDKKIMNAICGYCFKRELTHSNNFARIYRDFLRHEQLYENVSIITACAIYLSFYSVFENSFAENYDRVLSSMAIQFALEWATDGLSLYIESRVHRMDVLTREKQPRGFYFMICYTFFLGMAYSTSRIILITENKWL